MVRSRLPVARCGNIASLSNYEQGWLCPSILLAGASSGLGLWILHRCESGVRCREGMAKKAQHAASGQVARLDWNLVLFTVPDAQPGYYAKLAFQPAELARIVECLSACRSGDGCVCLDLLPTLRTTFYEQYKEGPGERDGSHPRNEPHSPTRRIAHCLQLWTLIVAARGPLWLCVPCLALCA